MLYDNNQAAMRQTFYNAWDKSRHHRPLSALETQIVAVITMHPEYHALLEGRDSLGFNQEENPFLHMGLHLAVREQIATNRPAGIRAVFDTLSIKEGVIEAEHKIMMCLKEVLWSAQQSKTMPDELAYLKLLEEIK